MNVGTLHVDAANGFSVMTGSCEESGGDDRGLRTTMCTRRTGKVLHIRKHGGVKPLSLEQWMDQLQRTCAAHTCHFTRGAGNMGSNKKQRRYHDRSQSTFQRNATNLLIGVPASGRMTWRPHSYNLREVIATPTKAQARG